MGNRNKNKDNNRNSRKADVDILNLARGGVAVAEVDDLEELEAVIPVVETLEPETPAKETVAIPEAETAVDRRRLCFL